MLLVRGGNGHDSGSTLFSIYHVGYCDTGRAVPYAIYVLRAFSTVMYGGLMGYYILHIDGYTCHGR